MDDRYDPIASVGRELEAEFGDRWDVWLSDTGRWWAARRNAMSAAELGARCVHFLRAADPTELARLVRAQEELSASVAGKTSQVTRAVDAQ